jgi:hypothetical protein
MIYDASGGIKSVVGTRYKSKPPAHQPKNTVYVTRQRTWASYNGSHPSYSLGTRTASTLPNPPHHQARPALPPMPSPQPLTLTPPRLLKPSPPFAKARPQAPSPTTPASYATLRSSAWAFRVTLLALPMPSLSCGNHAWGQATATIYCHDKFLWRTILYI